MCEFCGSGPVCIVCGRDDAARHVVAMWSFDYWFVAGVDCSRGRDMAYEQLAVRAKCRLYEALPDASDAFLTRKERLFRRLLERWARNW